MMTNKIFMLEAGVRECTVEVFLNGIPACNVVPEAGKFDAWSVNHLVVPGQNLVSAVICHGPTPSRFLQATEGYVPPKSASVSVRLAVYPQGALPDNPAIVPLTQLNWTAVGSSSTVPVVKHATFELPLDMPDWTWRQSRALRLTDKLRAEVTQILISLAQSLSRRDPEPFLSMAAPRTSDVAAAFGKSAGVLRQEFRTDFQKVSASADWRIQEPDPSAMDLRLCADDRMVDCIAVDWLPILRSQQEATGRIAKRYPVRLCLIGDQLRIVR